MNNEGFVYGIDHVNELVYQSIDNIKKNHQELYDDGKVILKINDGVEGLSEYAPYDCIHVGATVERIPRKLML